jgi:hypothetical protein
VSDIAYTAQVQYEHGVDPIDWAIEQTRITIDAREFVREARATNPALVPWYGPDLSDEALARRVVGHLLDAGWEPPVIKPEPPVPNATRRNP